MLNKTNSSNVITKPVTRHHLRGKTVTLTYASPYLLPAVTVTLNVYRPTRNYSIHTTAAVNVVTTNYIAV